MNPFTEILKLIGDLFTNLLESIGAQVLTNTGAPSSSAPVQNSTPPRDPVVINVQPSGTDQTVLDIAENTNTFYPRDVKNVAAFLQGVYPRLKPAIDPRVIACQAVVESGDVNNPLLALQGDRFHKDADGVSSYGLMQVRTTTALDMYNRAGFTAYGKPDEDKLNVSTCNIYFALAVHTDNYERYVKNNAGRVPSLQWQIQAYNGGYGNGKGGSSNAGQRVLDYYNKFTTVKNRIWSYLS